MSIRHTENHSTIYRDTRLWTFITVDPSYRLLSVHDSPITPVLPRRQTPSTGVTFDDPCDPRERKRVPFRLCQTSCHIKTHPPPPTGSEPTPPPYT